AAALTFTAVVFLVAYYVPSVRVALPSALDDPDLRSASVGVESADVDAAAERRLTVDAVTGASLVKVALQARCATRPRACCVSVDATVNGWNAPPLTITSAWHEVHLVPPPGVLRPGANTVVIKMSRPCDAREDCAGIGVALARTARS